MCEKCETEKEEHQKETWTIKTEDWDFHFTSENRAVYWDDEARLLSIESKDGKKRVWIPYERVRYVVREYEP